MKFIFRVILTFFLFHVCFNATGAVASAGFYLPDNVSKVTLNYKSLQNLVVLPVVINDSIKVNLILDTGCRNLVLFGKRFDKLFYTQPDKKVQFSGLGDGRPITGRLSINNKVSIQAVIGEKIPIVLIPRQNLFSAYTDIHGVIGYDIFIKFEIELNPLRQLITFRPAADAVLAEDYKKISIRIKDSRPLIHSQVLFPGTESQGCDLMLDTGSTLGLLVKTSDLKKFPKGTHKKILGRGLNGDVIGIETTAHKLILDTFEIDVIPAGVTYSAWHNYASVGMNVMKDYTIVLNYCKGYAGFKKTI